MWKHLFQTLKKTFLWLGIYSSVLYISVHFKLKTKHRHVCSHEKHNWNDYTGGNMIAGSPIMQHVKTTTCTSLSTVVRSVSQVLMRVERKRCKTKTDKQNITKELNIHERKGTNTIYTRHGSTLLKDTFRYHMKPPKHKCLYGEQQGQQNNTRRRRSEQ